MRAIAFSWSVFLYVYIFGGADVLIICLLLIEFHLNSNELTNMLEHTSASKTTNISNVFICIVYLQFLHYLWIIYDVRRL